MEGRDRRPVPAGEGSGPPCYAGPAQLMPQHGADAAVEDHRVVVGGDHFQVAEGFVCLPEDGELHALRLGRSDNGFHLEGDELRGRVALRVVSPD
jgi:hypothetical protein